MLVGGSASFQWAQKGHCFRGGILKVFVPPELFGWQIFTILQIVLREIWKRKRKTKENFFFFKNSSTCFCSQLFQRVKYGTFKYIIIFTSESWNGVEVMYYIDNNIRVHPMRYTGTRVIPLNCIVILFLNLRTKYGQILCVYKIIPCANPSLQPQPHITFL
jgi:hypothetical protein